jgi:small basic protein
MTPHVPLYNSNGLLGARKQYNGEQSGVDITLNIVIVCTHALFATTIVPRANIAKFGL